MAKLLLRSKSESRLGRKANKDASKSTDSLVPLHIPISSNEPLPHAQHSSQMQAHVPRTAGGLTVEIYATPRKSTDASRPKTSGGVRDLVSETPSHTAVSPLPGSQENARPKTSHGTRKGKDLEEPNFSTLNRSYTWTREQTGQSSPKPSPARQTNSPMLHAFPPRSLSRQKTLPVECEIGLALGSPTQAPKTLSDARSSRIYGPDALFSRSLPQHYVSLDSHKQQIKNHETLAATPIASTSTAPKEESSKGGWKKFFGKGLFHKKSSQKPHTTASPQISITTSTSTTTSYHDSNDSVDSLTENISNYTLQAEEPAPQPKPSCDITPVLDVDIPTVELERYSVMFDSLLNQQQQKPSIYARRKSNLIAANIGQKISENPVETPTLNLPVKKENLPLGLVNKSPLWLFPATPRTPRTPKSPGRPRAMTTPGESAAATELSTPDLDIPKKKSRPESDIMPSLLMMLEERSERTVLHSERVPPTPFSVISEASELDSPYSPSGFGMEDGGKAPWVRKFSMMDEPEWEMVTTTPLRPRTPSPTELQPTNDSETYVAKAATISIARQISISQRQLLLPVISHPERFVSRSRPVKSQTPKAETTPLSIPPSSAEFVNDAPTSAVSSSHIAMAL